MSFHVARLQHKDQVQQRSHDQLVALAAKLDALPILNGVLKQDIEFTVGVPMRVGHGLGRPYRGFFVALQSAAGSLAHSPSYEADTRNEICVTPSATMTASLWIF